MPRNPIARAFGSKDIKRHQVHADKRSPSRVARSQKDMIELRYAWLDKQIAKGHNA